jgi:hypothetical protein
LAGNEKVITADHGGPINLGKSRAGLSFRLVEQSSLLILEPVETVHLPPDDVLSYGDYLEQLSVLLFLKFAHAQTQPSCPPDDREALR